MQIAIKNPDGEFLAVMTPQYTGSELDRNLQILRTDKSTCSFSYNAADVPMLDTYLIDAGTRGEHYVQAENFGAGLVTPSELGMTDEEYEETFGDLATQIFNLEVG